MNLTPDEIAVLDHVLVTTINHALREITPETPQSQVRILNALADTSTSILQKIHLQPIRFVNHA